MFKDYDSYIGILKEELVPAMGCTEPIALAYGAAAAADFLHGEEPVSVSAACSRNILKNAMCVKVPNTGGLIGVEAAVLGGLYGGRSDLRMEVLSRLQDEDREKIRKGLAEHFCMVSLLESSIPLHFVLNVSSEHHDVLVEIAYKHTNIIRIVEDGREVDLKTSSFVAKEPIDRSVLSVEKIYEFAETVDLNDVHDLIHAQVEYNYAIAMEGLSGNYGVGISRAIFRCEPETLKTKMLAMTAGASEARMEGCAMPVVTNSGSGNQGITASVPVIVYCRENNIPEEKMYRALVLSNLLTVHQKTGIGTLSAFCGAVCAAIASAAAVVYLKGGTLREIESTITNSCGGVAGTVCDGAKATCGYKIYSALSASFLAGEMAMMGKCYPDHTGIIKEDVEESIAAIGKLGREGMAETDIKILGIMLEG